VALAELEFLAKDIAEAMLGPLIREIMDAQVVVAPVGRRVMQVGLTLAPRVDLEKHQPLMV
jgi:hypothetical protein